ncbi:MAG: cyclic nucleotide-binding domain-containing protein [Deltaproteobacteria bacterium]|nr:MAG: cyclic nucleotide-binding domain-containing protein [Deltaproteobacteria bacterium]
MFIERADLLKGMSREFVNEIKAIMFEESHPKGAFLFKEGDPANNFYILQEGGVKLTIGEQGHIVQIASNAGEAFGWSSLVGREAYTASAECLIPTRLMKIEKEKLNWILEGYPADGMSFFKGLARILGQRLLNSYISLLLAQPSETHRTYGSSLTLQQRSDELSARGH